jgi:single-stranded DNA-binding protein
LRIIVDGVGDLGLAAVMTGEEAARIRPGLKAGSEVMVKGSLKAIRRRLKSGLTEIAYEVMADSIEIVNRS